MKGAAQPLDSDLTVGAFVPLYTMRESSETKRKTETVQKQALEIHKDGEMENQQEVV